MSQVLRICTNADLPPEAEALLRAGIGANELTLTEQRVGLVKLGGPCEEFLKAQVAFGQPDPAQLLENKDLRLIQITSAGYTRYDYPAFWNAMKERGVAFCNSSSIFNEPCAQHILGFMLAWSRQLPAAIANQLNAKRWDVERLRSNTRLLKGDRVALVGYGAIGKRLVEILAPFGLEIVAIRRTVRGDEPVPCYPIAELEKWLPWADHVVNIVPANKENRHLFNRPQFQSMKEGAVFYNIGRGTTVLQDALIESLETGRLAAALLDVTDPEPLPPDHPLWNAPNCTITPHIGGGFKEEISALVQHFLDNLKNFETGQPLVDRVV
jgi:phosphoglycerate dehydrogenase-like enzyme